LSGMKIDSKIVSYTQVYPDYTLLQFAPEY